MFKFLFRKRILVPLLCLSVVLLSAGFGYWLRDSYLPKKKWAYAKLLIESNLTLMGLDVIEPYFRELANSPENCEVLIKAYSRAGSLQRMGYFAETCLAHGYEIPTVYLGMATFLSHSGNDSDALAVLAPQVNKFKDSYDIPYEVFRLLERKYGISEDAIKHLILAQTRTDAKNLLALEPLRELIQQQKWDLAYQLVEGISNHPGAMQDDALRMLISTVYRHQGERALARRFDVPSTGTASSR